MTQVLLPGDHLLSAGTQSVDLTVGGQNGAMTDPANWSSTSHYTKPKMICVLLQAPKALKYLPDGDSLRQQIKAMLEKHPREITGIDSGLVVENHEVVIGNSGNVMQTVAKVNRNRTVPSFVHDELRGKPFYKIIKTWIRELLQEPNSTYPGIISQPLYIAAGSPELLPEDVTAVLLFIEPSHNFQNVQEAWLSTNVYPLGTENIGTRSMGATNEGSELTTEFAAITDDSDAVFKMAQDYLDSINKAGFRPAALAAYVDGLEASLDDDVNPETDTSFRSMVNNLAEAVEDAT